MKRAKIVIGANFGDEGKGLMTDYFAHQSVANGQSCVVVCHNGGSQKGHTVTSPSGIRHVFHHFGAGTFQGADTYLAKEYVVNPMMFEKEFEELLQKGYAPKCFVNKDCKVTTPFDMLLNQMIEEYRQEGKHGSCGLGIFETLKRNIEKTLTIEALKDMEGAERYVCLEEIGNDYMKKRLEEEGVKGISEKWTKILKYKANIIENYLEDVKSMLEKVELCKDDVLDRYDNVIFEGAQGLLLDQYNTEYMPHLTPSCTGLDYPMQIIGERVCQTEVCYVTRTYLTRHGAGRLNHECEKEQLNPKIIDLTNVPNPYQDSLRYGLMEEEELFKRISKDYAKGKNISKVSLAITHINEYADSLDRLMQKFKGFNLYLSNGQTYENIWLK